MRFGAIPPLNHLDLARGRKYQLALAGVLKGSPAYATFLRNEAKNGSFIALDNGAYEGSALKAHELLALAVSVGAREIVLPDVLRDKAETIRLTEIALQVFKIHRFVLINNHMRLAIVPQGTNPNEWGECLIIMVKMFREYMGDFPLTITIPKHSAKWMGGRTQLFDRFVTRYHYADDVHTNLLGVTENLGLLKMMAREYPFRSVDSAKPFLYAMQRLELDVLVSEPPAMARPSDYFEYDMDGYQRTISKNNVEVYDNMLSTHPAMLREIIP